MIAKTVLLPDTAKKHLLSATLSVGLIASSSAVHADLQQDLLSCSEMQNGAARLQCYDRLATPHRQKAPTDAEQDKIIEASTASPSFADPAQTAAPSTTPLQARWELTADSGQGLLGLRPYRQTYGIAAYTSRINQQPFRPILDLSPEPALGLQKGELVFQLSFKTKLVSNLFTTGSNIWFAYTQKSQWQLFNSDASRPFRETNYEPELMWTAPLKLSLGDFHFRYASVGINHQSNGRGKPLSRSWNRLFAEVGGEYKNLAIWIRPWWRIKENIEDDDNPNIERYIGRAEITAVYRNNRHLYSLTVRNNFSRSQNRGSLRADWSFPLSGELRGYVQVFSGYGESLIDYNWRQTKIGAGIILTDWL